MLAARFRPEPDSLLAKGNAHAMSKHRLRMVLFYQQGETSNSMMVGAAHRTELPKATFSQ